MEVGDFYSTITTVSDNVQHSERSRLKSVAKLITLSMADLYIRSNYQDFERYATVDVAIAGDAEATLPALTEAVKMKLPASRRDALTARGEKFRKSHAAAFERARYAITADWDVVPVSTARRRRTL
jgi:thiamine pyrophosphate-dependent acetolactate synthase large subunit-like protein